MDNDGNELRINNIKEQFDENKIKKLINTYWRNPEQRFSSIKILDKDNNEYPISFMKKDLKRNLTIIDLLYLAAYDIVKDKHVYVTRFPVTNYQSIYPSRVSIMTTTLTEEKTFGDQYLINYPKVIEDYPCDETLFVDTCVLNNVLTSAMGADFDGDTISLRAVFTVEANKEAEDLINSKTMFLDQMGKNTRKLTNEAIQSLFSLTY
jgi:hypothetical protein